MFISEQYGEIWNLDGNYWSVMLLVGGTTYWNTMLLVGGTMYWDTEQEYTDTSRDVDMMLIGL